MYTSSGDENDENVVTFADVNSFPIMQTYRDDMQHFLSNKFNATNDAKQVHTWLFSQTETTNVGISSLVNSSSKYVLAKDDKQRMKVCLLELFTARTCAHKKLIADKYERLFENRMIADIRTILKKGFALEIIAGMIMTPAEFDAECLIGAMSKRNINIIISIIATKNFKQLKQIKRAYKDRNQSDIECVFYSNIIFMHYFCTFFFCVYTTEPNCFLSTKVKINIQCQQLQNNYFLLYALIIHWWIWTVYKKILNF